MLHFFTLVLIFTAYSFLGWLSESIYCSFPAKRFINRGFLTGPVCPVYGFGGLLVITLLTPFHSNLFLLFAAAVVLTSALEYATAVVLEKTFHAKYWDYSDKPLNLHGRVCLENSLMFGGMSVVAVLLIHPTLSAALERLPSALRIAAAVLLLCLYALDTALSVNAMHNLNGRLDELQTVFDELRERARTATEETKEALQATLFDRLDETTKARLRRIVATKSKLEAAVRLVQRRMIRAFPHMRSLRSNESLQRVREFVLNGARRVSDAVPAAISRKNRKHGGNE